MTEQLPAIIILVPLLAALLVTLAGLSAPRLSAPVAILGLALTLAATIAQLLDFQASGRVPVTYYLGGWDNPIPIGIHLRVDSLNVLVLVLVAAVALLAALDSTRRVSSDLPGKEPQFYALLLLLVTGLLGITISADAFNVFVLLEVASLTSYALIAIGPSPRAGMAAFQYIIIGTIGASFYLLGAGYLYAQTGSLNMAHIHSIIESKLQDPSSATGMRSIQVGFMFIMLGLWIKMALFPLHGWLANAYSHAPGISASLLAPLVTKVSIYAMARMMTGVFGVTYSFHHLDYANAIVWLSVAAILAGSCLALAQKDFKRMLCYLIVAEVGYMTGGLWLGNQNGMSGALFHILSDGLMTLCLFLAAGNFHQRTQDRGIASLHLLLREMPLTSAAFLVGALSMIGIPPTCGFFSKWYLVQGGIEAGHWGFVAALLTSSLINAILFFRVIEVLFFGSKPADSHGHHDQDESAPPLIAPARPGASAGLPLCLAAAAILLLGLFNAPVVDLLGHAIRSSLSPAFTPAP